MKEELEQRERENVALRQSLDALREYDAFSFLLFCSIYSHPVFCSVHNARAYSYLYTVLDSTQSHKQKVLFTSGTAGPQRRRGLGARDGRCECARVALAGALADALADALGAGG